MNIYIYIYVNMCMYEFIHIYILVYIWLDLAQSILAHSVQNTSLGIFSFRCVSQARSKAWGDLSDFCLVLKVKSFCMGRSGNLSQEMCPKNIFEKSGSLSKSWGDLFDFCRVLRGRSFCKAGPETCHKECARGAS